MRILAGVGAWLLGAGTATAGSLLAVSLLGQGIAASPGQQLTADAVNRALAREAHDASEAGARTAPATRTHVPGDRARRRRDPGRREPGRPRRPRRARAATASRIRPPSPAADGTVLTSRGGTVLAECRPAGAYLVSWSPVQGYEADDVTRGPVTTARVVFESDANSVTMMVSCPDGAAGAPVASSHVQPWGGGTDE